MRQGSRAPQNWKRRWFVLLDRQLIYYESEEVLKNETWGLGGT